MSIQQFFAAEAKLLPNPFIERDFGDGLPPIPLEEIRMYYLLQEITAKPNWYEKIFNQDIAQKWISVL